GRGPPAGTGHASKDRSFQNAGAASPGQVDSAGRDVEPEGGDAGCRQGNDVAARPAADIEHRRQHPPHQLAVDRIGLAEPAPELQLEAHPVLVDELRAHRATHEPVTAATAAGKRAPPEPAITERASSHTSTSLSAGRSATLSPRPVRRRRCTSQVWQVLMGTPRKAAASGRRSPAAHQPPSSAGPRTASTPGAIKASIPLPSSAGVT